MLRFFKSLATRLFGKNERRTGSSDDLSRSLAGGASDYDSGYESGSDEGGVEEHSYSAERYGYSPSHTSQTDIPFNETFPENTIIYTDASCGRFGDSAYAGFFGHEHPLNLLVFADAERVNPATTRVHQIEQRQRPDYVEILGATEALQRLKSWKGYHDQEVIIRTDNLHMIKGLNGNDQGFEREIDTLRVLASDFPYGVLFQHVFAHNGDPGNEKVDEMARDAMKTGRIYVEPEPVVGKVKRSRAKGSNGSFSKKSNYSTASIRLMQKSFSFFSSAVSSQQMHQLNYG